MIQTTYDPEADAMSVWFDPPEVVAAATEEAAPGIEVLSVRQRMRSAQPTAPAQSAA